MLSVIGPFALLFGIALSCFFLSDFVHSETIGTCNSQTKPILGKMKRIVPTSLRKEEVEQNLQIPRIARTFIWQKLIHLKDDAGIHLPRGLPELSSQRSLLASLLESASRRAKIVDDVAASEYFRFLFDRLIKSRSRSYPSSSSSSDTKGEVRESSSSSAIKSPITKHYACPPISVDTLRRRYGSATYLGDWSVSQTRRFYKSQLPKSLQIDGALGLNLEERARLASEARHALRLYSRERSILIARLLAELYDGVRHLQSFGYWSSQGMTWEEVKSKYKKEAKKVLGEDVAEEFIDRYVYLRIIERACATNSVLDDIAEEDRLDFKNLTKVVASLGISADKSSVPSFLRDFLPLLLLTMPGGWPI
jgi:hypothetical protein